MNGKTGSLAAGYNPERQKALNCHGLTKLMLNMRHCKSNKWENFISMYSILYMHTASFFSVNFGMSVTLLPVLLALNCLTLLHCIQGLTVTQGALVQILCFGSSSLNLCAVAAPQQPHRCSLCLASRFCSLWGQMAPQVSSLPIHLLLWTSLTDTSCHFCSSICLPFVCSSAYITNTDSMCVCVYSCEVQQWLTDAYLGLTPRLTQALWLHSGWSRQTA